MQLSKRLKEGYIETSRILKGSERRLFMARVVKMLGPGGQRYIERELGWNRSTIRKGMRELESGRLIPDNFAARGRKQVEEHLPNLLADLRDVIETYGQPEPGTRAIWVGCPQLRRLLINEKGYCDASLPTIETIRKKVHQLGYTFGPRAAWDN